MEEKEKKDKGNLIKTIAVAVFFAAIILIYFYSLNNRENHKRKDADRSELEQLMEYDMIGDYPKTPRDVVKLHSRYCKLIYTSDIKEEDLEVLNRQMRNLYSSELLSYNSETHTLQALKADLAKIDEEGYSYRSYTLPEGSQVQYYTQNGVEMATMEVTIAISSQEALGDMYQQYVLIKEDDEWKIQGWGESRLGDK